MRTRRAVDIFEEAVHLLRSLPLALFLPFIVGTLPFGLGLLWFTAEMSWSAYATEELMDASLIVALLFVWKQAWEAVFCVVLHERVSGTPAEPWTALRLARTVLRQAALQPLALIVLPLASVLIVPFPTAFAFFRNLSLYAGLGDKNMLRRSLDQASQGAKQNWVLHSFLFLLSLILLLNYMAAAMMLPSLAKSFLGVDTTMTRYGLWLLSWTGFTALSVLVYVTLEPVCCALYVLRCFYGQSISTGADLRAKLRRAVAASALALLLLVVIAAPSPVHAQERATVAVRPAELDRSVKEVLRRREFTWRMPRQEPDSKDRPAWASWIDGFFARAGEIWDWFKEGLRKMFDREGGQASKTEPATPYELVLRYSLWVLGALFAVGSALLLYRQYQSRRTVVIATPVAAAAPVDLRDESVTADKLPESSWMALAQEWIDKGDLRLALRAMHLAGLSYLNARNLVTVRRWKSGLEYSAEVGRRSRTVPEVAPSFRRNMRLFEAGWFGRHPVDRETLDAFARGLDEVRSHANRL